MGATSQSSRGKGGCGCGCYYEPNKTVKNGHKRSTATLNRTVNKLATAPMNQTDKGTVNKQKYGTPTNGTRKGGKKKESKTHISMIFRDSSPAV